MTEEAMQRVRYLREVMKLSFHQIEKETGISRKNASRLYRGCSGKTGVKRPYRLDGYRSLIGEWFGQYPNLKAKQVYAMLKERGDKTAYTTVVKYTRDFRKKREKVYHPLVFLSGEEAQVDWCFINHPHLGKLSCFVLILSYSRHLFARLYPRSSFEFFIDGHIRAFSSMNGIARSLRYDNLKSVVLKLRPEIEYNPRFLDFSRHFGTGIRLCNPGKGNEKGRVERVIRTMKDMFFNKTDHYTSLEALNQGLSEWVKEKNLAVHKSTGRTPKEMFEEEKVVLLPVPLIPWDNVTVSPPVRTTKTAMMIFDTNYYSVPDYLVGNALSIHASVDRVKIYDKEKEVADHPRSFMRNKQFMNPLHRSFGRMSEKAKMERIEQVIRGTHPALTQFLSQNLSYGEDPKKTAYEIFKAMKNHSRGIIISAASECMKRRSPRLATFISYLEVRPIDPFDAVSPGNGSLLNITYKARGLEAYDDAGN